MPSKKVKFLADNNGSWTYRRRVPIKHQKTLGFKKWNIPCGGVGYAQAVVMVTGWAAEHDALIENLDNPEAAAKVRNITEAQAMAPKVAGMVKAQKADVLPDKFNPLEAAVAGLKAADQNSDFDQHDRLVRYRAILEASFGSHVVVPTDPDERDEFDLVKRKLERRIADIAGDPNTISAVSERCYLFNQIRPNVLGKYRRNIRLLIAQTGDVPIKHLTASQLRKFRNDSALKMNPSSLSSLFTPIRSMLTFALHNDLIDTNPMASVPLQPDKRSIKKRRWLPFDPDEFTAIMSAMDEVWGSKVRGLSEERRLAIHMACRVMAYTAMRPKEVVSLTASDVTDRHITLDESKTVNGERCIPLHPAIADFPEFIKNGGFDTFHSQTKDLVQTVRHNFYRLTRYKMDPPISNPRKVLYSFRSTFSNAMGRSGSSPNMRRAIMGHSEAGALAHYDEGPYFVKKKKAVFAADPARPIPDDDDFDDADLDDLDLDD